MTNIPSADMEKIPLFQYASPLGEVACEASAKQDGEGYVKKEITANIPSANFETSLREGGGTRDQNKESAYSRITRVTEGARRAVEKLWKDQICCFSRALSTASGPPLSRREVKGTLSVSPWLTPLPRERHIGIADFLSISADGMFVISASSIVLARCPSTRHGEGFRGRSSWQQTE